MRYKEAHPEGDYSRFPANLTMEMVRRTVYTISLPSHLFQDTILKTYKRFPQSETVKHRLHPSAAILAIEFQEANIQQRPPDFSTLSVDAITRRCKLTSDAYPLWPTILVAPNLERLAMEEVPADMWWIPAPPPEMLDDDGEDEIMDDGDNGAYECYIYCKNSHRIYQDPHVDLIG
jgi:hypothetical protein